MDSPDCSEHIRFFLLFSFFCFTLFSCRFRQWRNDEVAAASSDGGPGWLRYACGFRAVD